MDDYLAGVLWFAAYCVAAAAFLTAAIRFTMIGFTFAPCGFHG